MLLAKLQERLQKSKAGRFLNILVCRSRYSSFSVVISFQPTPSSHFFPAEEKTEGKDDQPIFSIDDSEDDLEIPARIAIPDTSPRSPEVTRGTPRGSPPPLPPPRTPRSSAGSSSSPRTSVGSPRGPIPPRPAVTSRLPVSSAPARDATPSSSRSTISPRWPPPPIPSIASSAASTSSPSSTPHALASSDPVTSSVTVVDEGEGTDEGIFLSFPHFVGACLSFFIDSEGSSKEKDKRPRMQHISISNAKNQRRFAPSPPFLPLSSLLSRLCRHVIVYSRHSHTGVGHGRERSKTKTLKSSGTNSLTRGEKPVAGEGMRLFSLLYTSLSLSLVPPPLSLSHTLSLYSLFLTPPTALKLSLPRSSHNRRYSAAPLPNFLERDKEDRVVSGAANALQAPPSSLV